MNRVGGQGVGRQLGTGPVQRISKGAPAPREEMLNLEIAHLSRDPGVFFHSDVGYERVAAVYRWP
jgi:hypothetical protein